MAPKNPVVNQLFGVTHGLSMGIFTFDWGQISYTSSPLPVPWWAAANVGLTILFFYWFLVPILYVSPPCFCPFLFSSSENLLAVHERVVQRSPSFGFLTLIR